MLAVLKVAPWAMSYRMHLVRTGLAGDSIPEIHAVMSPSWWT